MNIHVIYPKGCSASCYIDVDITELEAEYIAIKKGITHNIPTVDCSNYHSDSHIFHLPRE